MIPGSNDNNESLSTKEPSSTNYESSMTCQRFVTSPELSRYSIYVDPIIHVVICLTCSKAVHLDNVRSHLVSHDFKGVPKGPDLRSFLIKLGALPTNCISFPTNAIEPIVGLDIIDGFKCLEGDCDYISTSENTRQTHFREQHSQQYANGVPRSTETIQVQLLYGFQRDRVVLKVSHTSNRLRPTTTDAYERYMSQVASRKSTDPPTYQPPPDQRPEKLSHFLQFTGWGSVLEGKDIAAIQELVKSPLKQDRFYPIIAGCRSYYQHIASKLPGISDLFLRWVNTSKTDLENKPFQVPQTEKYLFDCSDYEAHFLVFIMRTVNNLNPDGYSPLLTLKQIDAAKALNVALDQPEGPESQLFAPIHSLAYTLISACQPEVAGNQFLSPHILYLIYSNILPDSVFKTPEAISKCLSKLSWVTRGTAVCEALEREDDYPDGLLGFYNAVLKPMLTEGANFPMTHIRATFHKIWWLIKCSPHIPSCLISADKSCVTYNGTPVLISDIPAWYQRLLHEAEVLLKKALLGLAFPEFEELVTKRLDASKPLDAFIDIHNKRDVGYSFLTEAKNGLKDFESALLLKIFKNEKLNSQFYVYDLVGNPYPRAGRQMAWFHDVSKLIDILFVGSHVGPGGVARGTEVQTLSSVNVEECPRSLYIMHGYLTSILQYNKTRHNTQTGKLIARFFPPRLGRLFLYYLAIIRPLEKVWADDVFGAGKSSEYRHLVFVRHANPMLSHHFSKALYDSSLDHIHIGLGIRDYRQFIKAILRIVLDIDYESGKLEDDSSIDVSDASFGHSRAIGATYGLSYTDLPNLGGDLLRVHQKYCEHVHRWLGEGQPLPKRVDPLNMTQMTSLFDNMSNLVDKALERNPTQETVVSTIKDAVTDALKAGIQHILTPAIGNAVTSETSHALSNMPWQYLIGADTRVPEDCHTPVVVRPSTLRSLRRLLDEGATPKSPEQSQLLQLAFDHRFHVIGILPTGGGKSVIYQAPAFCDKSGITVSIFPFRTLTQDQLIQASNLGIRVATWPERPSQLADSNARGSLYPPFNPDQTQLVCVSMDHAGHEDFLPWLQAILEASHLKRVVVDEAHELLMGEDQACITNLCKIRQLKVPIICLSATLTPAAVPSLIDFFGFPSSLLRIVRADTPRPSIAYHAVQVTEEELFSAIVREIENFPLKEHERGLVFCNSYQDCNALNTLTGIPVYYGQSDEHNMDPRADMWQSGNVQRLICTSGFGNGVNNSHCRHVVHCRDPKKLCRYIQETGRAGRDGEKARAVLFFTNIPGVSNIKAPDAAGQLAMSQYLSLGNQCRRLVISSWSDGKERLQSCSSIPAAELCDWCSITLASDI